MKVNFNKLNKLTLPVAILIASVILGGFYYATQVSKQKSIERQQLELEQEHKKYVAKRKQECYEMYLSEKKQDWNLVDYSYWRKEDHSYLEKYGIDIDSKHRDDTCELIYINTHYNEEVCEQKLKELDQRLKEYDGDKRALIIECQKYLTEYR